MSGIAVQAAAGGVFHIDLVPYLVGFMLGFVGCFFIEHRK